MDQPEAVIDLDAHIAQLTTPAEAAWDQLLDALDPVRRLAQGPDALIPPATYTTYRTEQRSVLARVSPVASTTPWAFLAIKGTQTGAPHWLLLEGHPATIEQDLAQIADRLRTLLGEDPPPREPDDTFTVWLRRFLATATAHETRMLPRRQQRALGQMARITDRWRSQALASGDYDTAARWAALHALANPDSHDPTDQQADPRAVAHAWLHLMQPLLDAPAVTRNTRLLRLADLDPSCAPTRCPPTPSSTRCATCPPGPPGQPSSRRHHRRPRPHRRRIAAGPVRA